MDKTAFKKIWELQESFQTHPEYQQLLAEHERLNAKLLKQLDTMNDSQRNAVLDYCGILIELHLKMLEYSVQSRQ